jgi:hypothetical protein
MEWRGGVFFPGCDYFIVLFPGVSFFHSSPGPTKREHAIIFSYPGVRSTPFGVGYPASSVLHVGYGGPEKTTRRDFDRLRGRMRMRIRSD